MCYSAQDSQNAYLVGSLLCGLFVFGIKNPSIRSLSLFLWFVAQMQLLDFIFWTTPGCTDVNAIATKMAIVFNHLQPFVYVGAQAFFDISIHSLSVLVLIVYTIGVIPYTIQALATVTCTRPEGGSMKWKWNTLPGAVPFYILFMASLLATSFNYPSTRFAGMAATLSIVSFLVARKIPILNESIGRIWCYYASISPLFMIPWL